VGDLIGLIVYGDQDGKNHVSSPWQRRSRQGLAARFATQLAFFLHRHDDRDKPKMLTVNVENSPPSQVAFFKRVLAWTLQYPPRVGVISWRSDLIKEG
jgi:hypothetical protein